MLKFLKNKARISVIFLVVLGFLAFPNYKETTAENDNCQIIPLGEISQEILDIKEEIIKQSLVFKERYKQIVLLAQESSTLAEKCLNEKTYKNCECWADTFNYESGEGTHKQPECVCKADVEKNCSYRLDVQTYFDPVANKDKTMAFWICGAGEGCQCVTGDCKGGNPCRDEMSAIEAKRNEAKRLYDLMQVEVADKFSPMKLRLENLEEELNSYKEFLNSWDSKTDVLLGCLQAKQQGYIENCRNELDYYICKLSL